MEFPKFPKIEGPFGRDPMDPKKINREWYRSELVGFLADKHWHAVEKIDGTNVRICWDGYRVSFLGRQDTSEWNKGLLDYLTTVYGNETFELILEDAFGGKPVMIVGEGFGGNIQKAGPGYGGFQFRAFAMWSPDIWWRLESVIHVCAQLGVPTAPEIITGTLDQIIGEVQDDYLVSRLGHPEPEGYVCRPVVDVFDQWGNPLMVKVKRDNV